MCPLIGQKRVFYQSIKHRKSVVYCFLTTLPLCHKANEEAAAVFYTVIKLKKCRKHSPAAHVFYISFEFSNASHVLSQCNTWLRLLYVLNNVKKRKLKW